MSRQLQSLRQNDVRRAIDAGRRKGAVVEPASSPQIATLEKTLTEESAKRDALKTALDKVENRNEAIEKAILSAPYHKPKRSGLSGQIEALSAISRDNPKLLILIIAFELISLALELGPMVCAAVYIPSALAARVALEHFIEVRRTARSG
jgi:hypothetical protein